MNLFYRWVKKLPFNVILVYGKAYQTPEKAEEDLKTLSEVFHSFELMRDDELASIDAYVLSVPLKRS